MGRQLTQEEVIKQFKNIHGDKYGYDKVVYIRSNNKVSIYCKKCEEYFEQQPNDHKRGIGCPYCRGLKICKKNMLSTVRPDLIKYFINVEEADKYTISSSKKVKLRCPNCRKEKEMQVFSLSKNGFACPNCSDGISIPEKFCIGLLKQLNIEFEKEKTFDWSQNRRYDFYIESLSIILEVHGVQHYVETNRTNLIEIQKNDNLKEKLAKENKIKHYIIIDGRESNFHYLKESFINSLNMIFNLSTVNWFKIWEDCQSNLKNNVWDAWNNRRDGDSIKTLSNNFMLPKSTISRYLKCGEELEKCNYNPTEEIEKGSKKRVYQYNLDGTFIQDFISASEASRQLKISNSSISQCCNNKQKTAGNFKWSFNPPQ